jgi:hypothetical protein
VIRKMLMLAKGREMPALRTPDHRRGSGKGERPWYGRGGKAQRCPGGAAKTARFVSYCPATQARKASDLADAPQLARAAGGSVSFRAGPQRAWEPLRR